MPLEAENDPQKLLKALWQKHMRAARDRLDTELGALIVKQVASGVGIDGGSPLLLQWDIQRKHLESAVRATLADFEERAIPGVMTQRFLRSAAIEALAEWSCLEAEHIRTRHARPLGPHESHQSQENLKWLGLHLESVAGTEAHVLASSSKFAPTGTGPADRPAATPAELLVARDLARLRLRKLATNLAQITNLPIGSQLEFEHSLQLARDWREQAAAALSALYPANDFLIQGVLAPLGPALEAPEVVHQFSGDALLQALARAADGIAILENRLTVYGSRPPTRTAREDTMIGRWWCNERELLWSRDDWRLFFLWDNGILWGLHLGRGSDQAAAENLHWDHGAAHFVENRLPDLGSDLAKELQDHLRRVSPLSRYRMSRLDLNILNRVASAVTQPRPSVTAKRLRKEFEQYDAGEVNTAAQALCPRYIESRDGGGSYEITFAGLLESNKTGPVGQLIEVTLAELQRAYSLDPDIVVLMWSPIRDALALGNEDLTFARNVFQAMGWPSTTRQEGTEWTFDVPEDIEQIHRCANLSDYLVYLRQQSTRPWPSCPDALRSEHLDNKDHFVPGRERDQLTLREGISAEVRPSTPANQAGPWDDDVSRLLMQWRDTLNTLDAARGGDGSVLLNGGDIVPMLGKLNAEALRLIRLHSPWLETEWSVTSTRDTRSDLEALSGDVQPTRVIQEMRSRLPLLEALAQEAQRKMSPRPILPADKPEHIPSAYTHLEGDLNHFWYDYTFERSVFVMMRFPDPAHMSNTQVKCLDDLYAAVKEELDRHGLVALRADKKTYASSRLLWDNLCIYMLGCRRGVAILEDHIGDELNPNVTLEYGFMKGLGREVVLLKERRFKHLRADLAGTIPKEFDITADHAIDKRSVEEAMSRWLIDIDVPQKRAR